MSSVRSLLIFFHQIQAVTLWWPWSIKLQPFFKAPLRELRSSICSSYNKEARFMINHIDRKKNELTFLKCEQSSCLHCQQHPFKTDNLYKEEGYDNICTSTKFDSSWSLQHISHRCVMSQQVTFRSKTLECLQWQIMFIFVSFIEKCVCYTVETLSKLFQLRCFITKAEHVRGGDKWKGKKDFT